MAMILRITKAGRQALVNSQGNGTAQTKIVAMGVTAQSFVFDEDMTALPAEIKRVTELGGKALDGSQISLSVTDQSTDTYEIRGFGLYFEDGTLFAVYSQAGLVLEKSEDVPYIFQFDISITDAEIDATQITFGEMVFYNPPATETIVGVARIATEHETHAGTEKGNVFITPFLLKKAIENDLPQATQAVKGIGRIATLEEALNGNLDSNVFITPATLSQVIALTGVPIGAVLPYSAIILPPGYLRANGGQRNKNDYPELFEVYQYTYGGSGDMFGIPEVRGDALRFLDDGRGIDINRELGSEQGDAIRNITGGADTYIDYNKGSTWGAIYPSNWSQVVPLYDNVNFGLHSFYFDASRVVPVANENRMRNVALYGLIKAYTPRSI